MTRPATRWPLEGCGLCNRRYTLLVGHQCAVDADVAPVGGGQPDGRWTVVGLGHVWGITCGVCGPGLQAEVLYEATGSNPGWPKIHRCAAHAGLLPAGHTEPPEAIA